MGHGKSFAGMLVVGALLMADPTALNASLIKKSGGTIALRSYRDDQVAAVDKSIKFSGRGVASVVSPPTEDDPLPYASMTVDYDLRNRGSRAGITIDYRGQVWAPWAAAAGNVDLSFQTKRPLYYQFTVDLTDISIQQRVSLDDVEASLWFDEGFLPHGTMAGGPPEYGVNPHFSTEGILWPGTHTFSAAGFPYIDRLTEVPIHFTAQVDMRLAKRADILRLGDASPLAQSSDAREVRMVPEPAAAWVWLAGSLGLWRRLGGNQRFSR